MDSFEKRLERVLKAIDAIPELLSLENDLEFISTEIESGSLIPDSKKYEWDDTLEKIGRLNKNEIPEDNFLNTGLAELISPLQQTMEKLKENSRYNDDSWNYSDCWGESGDGWLASGC